MSITPTGLTRHSKDVSSRGLESNRPTFLLLYPPFAEPYAPYLSLPELSAVLKQAGFSCHSRDVNFLAHEELLNGHGFAVALKSAQSENESTRLSPRVALHPAFPLFEARFVVNSVGSFLADRLDWAKRALRDQQTYCFDPAGIPNGNKPFHVFDLARRLYFTSPLFDKNISHHDQGYYLARSNLASAVANPEYSVYSAFYRATLLKDAHLRPDVVGVSLAFAEQLLPGFLLALEAQRIWPEAVILAGGNYVSLLIDKLRNLRFVFDIVHGLVEGDGEPPLLAIGHNLERGRTWWTAVPNLISLRNGTVVGPESRADWDVAKSPPPDFDDFAIYRYFTAHPQTVYMTARGCYWGQCRFCNFPATRGYYRPRPVTQVVSDIKELTEKYGSRALYLADDAVSPGRVLELARGFNAAGLDLNWWCLSRFDRARGRLWGRGEVEEILQSGCYRIFFGGESFNESVQSHCHKGFGVPAVRKSLDELRGTGLHVHVSMIIGMPGESIDSAKNTVEELLSYARLPRFSARIHRFRLSRRSAFHLDKSFGITVCESECTDLAPNIVDYRESGRVQDEQRCFMSSLTEIKKSFMNRYDHLPLHSYPENHNYEGLQYHISYKGEIPQALLVPVTNLAVDGALVRLHPAVAFGMIGGRELLAFDGTARMEPKQDIVPEADYVVLYNVKEERFCLLRKDSWVVILKLEPGCTVGDLLGLGIPDDALREMLHELRRDGWIAAYQMPQGEKA